MTSTTAGGQRLDRNGMSGFMAKPYLLLPYSRKETRRTEKDKGKKESTEA